MKGNSMVADDLAEGEEVGDGAMDWPLGDSTVDSVWMWSGMSKGDELWSVCEVWFKPAEDSIGQSNNVMKLMKEHTVANCIECSRKVKREGEQSSAAIRRSLVTLRLDGSRIGNFRSGCIVWRDLADGQQLLFPIFQSEMKDLRWV